MACNKATLTTHPPPLPVSNVSSHRWKSETKFIVLRCGTQPVRHVSEPSPPVRACVGMCVSDNVNE